MKFTDSQKKGLDINRSVWIVANAGSGKTAVLINRVIRLLINRCKPGKILCITFTQAASIEMKQRIMSKLERWAYHSSEEEIKEDLKNLLDGKEPASQDIKIAKKLFFEILEERSHALNIQTMHSFCATLLGVFSDEAGLRKNSRNINQKEGEQLRNACLMKSISFLDYVLINSIFGSIFDLDNFLDQINQNTFILKRYFKGKDFTNVVKNLWESYELDLGYLCDSWDNDKTGSERLKLHKEERKKIIMSHSNRAKDFIDNINNQSVLASSSGKSFSSFEFGEHDDFETIEAGWNKYKEQFLTKGDNSPRKNLVKKGDDVALHIQLIANICDKLELIDRVFLSEAFLFIAWNFLNLYSDEKAKLNYLDYGDFIERAYLLLNQESENMHWIRYKMNGGIDHVLIDESQDLNQEQWGIIDSLVSEYSCQENWPHRTLMVVGDPKQSIYSFQGSDLRVFNLKQKAFQENFINQAMHKQQVSGSIIDLKISFRSSKPILNLINNLIDIASEISTYNEKNEESEKYSILDAFKDSSRHETALEEKVATKGIVELIPMDLDFEKQKNIKEEGSEQVGFIFENQDYLKSEYGKDSYQIERADLISQKILDIRKSNLFTQEGEEINYGDFMLLFETRSDFMKYVMESFEKYSIPYVGFNRKSLGKYSIIKDLKFALRAGIDLHDELSTMSFLRSAFCRLSKCDISNIRISMLEDTSKNILDLLQEEGSQKFLNAFRQLQQLKNLSAICSSPGEFFNNLICFEDNFEKIKRNYGGKEVSLLEEFFKVCHDYQDMKGRAGSLYDFAGWMDNLPLEKGSSSSQEDKVKLMTIHGSKGMESKVVFLMDCSDNFGFVRKEANRVVYTNDFPIFMGKTRKNDSFFKEEKVLAENQNGRLMYVAITRASRALYVCSSKSIKKDSWYSLIESAQPRSN